MADTFRDLMAENKRKSFWLVVGFFLFTLVVSGVLGVAILLAIDPSLAENFSWVGGVITGLIAAALSFLFMYFAYIKGDSMILGVSGATPIEKADDPQLFNVVEEMAIAAGVPMPKVYLIDDSAPNAFATGRDPEHASVAITTGLRAKLNREELQGVIAHEMAHVRNFDIRLMMLMAVLIGSIVMLADFFWRIMLYSRGGRRSSERDNRGKGLIVVVVIILAVVLAMVAPILAQIIQLAVSRQREYLADASAVEFTRNPLGLANALRKIDDDPEVLESANRGTAHLYIANPIKRFEARASSMFASHPPIKDRIQRLEALVQ